MTIDRRAAAHDRSRAWMVSSIVRGAAEREAAVPGFVDESIADLDAVLLDRVTGETVGISRVCRVRENWRAG